MTHHHDDADRHPTLPRRDAATPRDPRRGAAPAPTRRQVLAFAAGAFVVAGLPALAARRVRRLWRRRLPLMGTFADVAVVHDDRALALAAIDASFAALVQLEQRLTRFRDDSEVGRANRVAAREALLVGPDTAHVLSRALAWAEASDGAFDPCLGGAVALWDVTHRHAPPPTDAVAALAGRRLYRALDLASGAGGARVRFADPAVRLDLGGIGKGFAVDRAVDVLRAHGIERGFVNLGGDLYALGCSDDGDPWRVGIADPADPTRLLGELLLEDGAAATSGDAEQGFDHAGRRYHHLLDPATGAPRRSTARSLTVTADRCLDADAAATACFGREPGWAAACLARVAPDAVVVG